MLQGYTKILAASTARFPLWDLLFILKAGIENVTRTAPDVETFKMFIV
jgi:hypothetical protein